MNMGFSVKILADSITPSGARIMTVHGRYWRFIHPEVMTHRSFSRSAASSRAIPLARTIETVEKDPAMPIYWGANRAGMSAAHEMDLEDVQVCQAEWLLCRDSAVKSAKVFMDRGLHKQTANRVLEPYSWIDVVITATEWDNFFDLRCAANAQPEMQVLANEIRRLRHASRPSVLMPGEWHVPFAHVEDAVSGLSKEDLRLVAAMRAARVSYGRHDGRFDIADDLAKAKGLIAEKHWSPFEHIAQAHELASHRSRNFTGFTQLRSLIGG